MTSTTFLVLLFDLSFVNAIITEAIKKATINTPLEKLSNNALSFIVAVIAGIAGMIYYYGGVEYVLDLSNLGMVAFVCLANWICSMIGYDKVVQTFNQMKSIK